MLSGLDLTDPFARPHPIDPFANYPSTTTLATFPSISSANSEGDSLRAVVGLASPERPPKSSTPPSSQRTPTHGKTPSGSSSHRNLFGRSPSKQYPRGDREDDREESISLFPSHGREAAVEEQESEKESEQDVEARAESDFGEDVSKRSIRLVPNQNRF